MLLKRHYTMTNKNRLCKKCNKKIPWTIKIEGKTRHLGNRKYCLKCSPFGQHNTKKDIDTISFNFHKPYIEWTQEQKDYHAALNHKKRLLRKKELIKLHGGKCNKCNYDKCLRALTFHHREPKEKEFDLNQRSIQTKNWDIVVKESNKCDLLCSNCHMEIEESNSEIGKYEQILINKFGKDWANSLAV